MCYLIQNGPSIHDTPLPKDRTSRFIQNIVKFVPATWHHIPRDSNLHRSISVIS